METTPKINLIFFLTAVKTFSAVLIEFAVF